MSPQFKVWNPKKKEFFIQGDTDSLECALFYFEVTAKVDLPCQYIGLKDKSGRKIYANSEIVKFKFSQELNKFTELIGVFSYQEEELRYEIEIFNNPYYLCLSYMSNGQMYDFEVIGTVEQNPELIQKQIIQHV